MKKNNKLLNSLLKFFKNPEIIQYNKKIKIFKFKIHNKKNYKVIIKNLYFLRLLKKILLNFKIYFKKIKFNNILS